MTYLTAPQVKSIIRLCGQEIRRFLGESDAKDFTRDSKAAITAFKERPEEFTDEALLAKGADVTKAHQYSVRIELRGASAEGAAQVVAEGVWGKARTASVKALRKELEKIGGSLQVRTAGSSSFEFNREGVDKGLPIRYLHTRWDEILDQMGYTAGPIVDSRKSRMVIAADGDGTLYEGPKTTHLPFLKDSPTFSPVLSYLKAGGVLMLVSGNDMNRTFKRLIEGMPREVHCCLLLAANGGADLACVSEEAKPVFIKDYRLNALEFAAEKHRLPALDIVYLGDDDALDGNDRAAFETVGPKRAVLVRTLFDTQAFLEKWMHERKISIA